MVGAAVLAGTGTYLVQHRQIGRLDHERRGLIAQYEKLTADRDASLARRGSETKRIQTPARISKKGQKKFEPSFKGMQIVAKKVLADDRVEPFQFRGSVC